MKGDTRETTYWFWTDLSFLFLENETFCPRICLIGWRCREYSTRCFPRFLGKKELIATTYQYSGLFIHFYKKPLHWLSTAQNSAERVENKMQEEYRLTLQMKYYSLGELDEGIFEKDDVEQLLSKVIDSLPERCREIFLKSKIEGKKQKEIAEEMNISINTVETQMGIAYKKLRNELKDYFPLFIFLYYL